MPLQPRRLSSHATAGCLHTSLCITLDLTIESQGILNRASAGRWKVNPEAKRNVLDSFRLDGKVGLVTGAGSGLGRAFAEALAEAGADVACVDIKPDTAQDTVELVRELGRAGHAIGADVSDERAVDSAFRQAEEALGPLDVVFANAGVAGEAGDLEETTLSGWQEVIDVDLTGTYLTVRAAAGSMVPRGYGKIVTTASLYGLRGDPLFGIYGYTAAKSGVVGLTRSAAINLGPKGIRINAIAPGYIRTQIAGGHMFSNDPEAVRLRETIVERTPLGRVGDPEDLKGLAVFLASPASDYCTGWTFAVDGGWLAS
ncbi:MAG: SDR family oxidoreductase [Streptosporangiales bacterium]|nr:SDR family oxidoreductase [Streptosporangiales bacterium]